VAVAAEAKHLTCTAGAKDLTKRCSEARASLRSTFRVFAIHALAASHAFSGSRSLILCLVRSCPPHAREHRVSSVLRAIRDQCAYAVDRSRRARLRVSCVLCVSNSLCSLVADYNRGLLPPTLYRQHLVLCFLAFSYQTFPSVELGSLRSFPHIYLASSLSMLFIVSSDVGERFLVHSSRALLATRRATL
jgi:hypothetical protein